MDSEKSYRVYIRKSAVPHLTPVCRRVIIPSQLIPLVTAHLTWLEKKWAWDGTIDEISLAQTAIQQLIYDLNTTSCEGDLPPLPCECCVEYLPNHPSIEWNPDPPYKLSNPLDFNAVTRPWYTGKNLPLGLGLLPGTLDSDVYTFARVDISNPLGYFWQIIEGALSFIDEGFPRFKIRFEGKKRVQIYMVGMPLGGSALVSLDGKLVNPIPQWIDLNSLDSLDVQSYFSLLSSLGKTVTGSNWNSKIIEVETDTEGEHYIDVTMLPNIGFVEPIPLPTITFGGGLRKVVICGDPGECPDCPDCPDPEPCPEPEKPVIRQEGDAIEWWDGTKWVFLQKVADSGCDCDDCGCDDDCDDCDCDDDCDDCEEW